MNTDRPILIFDGVCELCNASVDFIIKREKQPDLLFTANQNPAGIELLTQFGESPEDVSTLFLVQDGKLYQRSTAALKLARMLKLPWNIFYVFIIVPRFIRDPIYSFIAKRRYKLFGKKETCRIPTQEEIARFLID